MKIEIKSTGMIMRIVKTANGENLLQIIGTGLEIPEEINTNDHYLALGTLSFDIQHLFKGFMLCPGATPNQMITGGALNHSNYEKKII